MAINRQPREDLMRDATAYPRRLLLHHPRCNAIFIGFRNQGGWSVYFGEDPVYQFNAQQKLRRVHFEKQNYAAEQGKLLRLNRQRPQNQSLNLQNLNQQNSGGRIELDRIHDELDEQRVLQDCHTRISALMEWIEQGSVTVSDRFPEDCEFIAEVAKLLKALASGIVLADSSAV